MIGFSTGSTAVAAGALSLYFEKYYNIAISLFTCGKHLGIIVMPILTQYLQDVFGWRGASLLLCGLSLHAVACAMLFTPVRKNDYYLVSDAEDLKNFKNPNHNLNKMNTKNSIRLLITRVGDYLDISLFSNFSFIALLILHAGDGFYTTSWLIYVVPHALDVGFTPPMASFVASVGGVGSLVGSCLFPILGQVMSSKAQLYASICLIATSFAAEVAVIGLVSYIGMITCSIVFGVARGTLVTAMFAVINDTTEEEKVINAVSWCFAVYGLTSILGGFLCGKLLSVL